MASSSTASVCHWKAWFYSDSVWIKCSLSLSFFSLTPFYALSSSPFFSPLLPALLRPYLPCSNGPYLQLSGRWKGWRDVEVYSRGSISAFLPTSKNYFQANPSSHVFCWSVRMRGKNTLALPEKGFGKNQICGTEWFKVISIKNKSWSAAPVLPSLSLIVLSLDTHLMYYMNGLCLNFSKKPNDGEEVLLIIGHFWAWHGKEVISEEWFLFFLLFLPCHHSSASIFLQRPLEEGSLLGCAHLHAHVFPICLVLVWSEFSGEQWPLLCP